MGLSISYSGKIKDVASLPLLIGEVKDISDIYGWKYHIYKESFPYDTFDNQEYLEPIYGINFTPPNCETISFTFLSNGVMVCPARILFFGNSDNEQERSYIYANSVKTQYAGIIIHQLIIALFKYLNNKYFTDFQMSDESHYWETGDENLMREKFREYDTLLDNFTLSMRTFPLQKGENMISYFERLLEQVNNLRKR